MKRVETDKSKDPDNKARKKPTRFSDEYHWSRDAQSRGTTSSSRERSAHEIHAVDRNQHHHHHRSTPKDSSSGAYPSSSSASGSGDTRRSHKLAYTATPISGLRYKFHSYKNGMVKDKPADDEEDVMKFRKKPEASASKDLNSSLPPPNKRKNPEPENIEEKKRQTIGTVEFIDPKLHLNPSQPPQNKRKNPEPEDFEEKRRQAIVARDIVNLELHLNSPLPPQNKRKNAEPEDFEEKKRKAFVATEIVNPESNGIQELSKDDCNLVHPPDIQTRKVDEPQDDDDEEEDLDILIIDLSDKERAEMESWAK